MNKRAIISVTISITTVYLIARCIGITMPPQVLLGGIAGAIMSPILHQSIIPAVKRYWGK